MVSLPEVLRQNGYSTGAFGKWNNTALWKKVIDRVLLRRDSGKFLY
jgi:arylsulfatase A-like enzyme